MPARVDEEYRSRAQSDREGLDVHGRANGPWVPMEHDAIRFGLERMADGDWPAFTVEKRWVLARG